MVDVISTSSMGTVKYFGFCGNKKVYSIYTKRFYPGMDLALAISNDSLYSCLEKIIK